MFLSEHRLTFFPPWDAPCLKGLTPLSCSPRGVLVCCPRGYTETTSPTGWCWLQWQLYRSVILHWFTILLYTHAPSQQHNFTLHTSSLTTTICFTHTSSLANAQCFTHIIPRRTTMLKNYTHYPSLLRNALQTSFLKTTQCFTHIIPQNCIILYKHYPLQLHNDLHPSQPIIPHNFTMLYKHNPSQLITQSFLKIQINYTHIIPRYCTILHKHSSLLHNDLPTLSLVTAPFCTNSIPRNCIMLYKQHPS